MLAWPCWSRAHGRLLRNLRHASSGDVRLELTPDRRMRIIPDFEDPQIRLTAEHLARIREHPEMLGLEHAIEETQRTPAQLRRRHPIRAVRRGDRHLQRPFAPASRHDARYRTLGASTAVCRRTLIALTAIIRTFEEFIPVIRVSRIDSIKALRRASFIQANCSLNPLQPTLLENRPLRLTSIF